VSIRKLLSIFASVALVAMLPIAAHSAPASLVRAGVGIADATWQVGTGSGQYAAKSPNAVNLATGGDIDPYFHGVSQEKSYGVQSRLSYRALVVEGANGKRIALVKSDSYLAQDFLVRRAAQILAADGSSISYDQIMLHASHNHSSPYYMSPSWGVWLFQDMFDIRTFEYHARAIAHAIEAAEKSMVPVRMGATRIKDTIYKGMIAGATITDDGSPGGYPETQKFVCPAGDPNPIDCDGQGGWGVFDDTIVRFDDVTDPANPKPLAIWMNHGEHPESNDGYALITADYLGPLERDVLRATGATLVFSQADVGSSEGPYCSDDDNPTRCKNNQVLPDGVIRAWAHVAHAQTERGAKYMADLVKRAFDRIGSGDPSVIVPFTTDFPVDSFSNWAPNPLSHPYPAVGNCRTETTIAGGNPGAPAAGLPDCQRGDLPNPASGATAAVYQHLKDDGVPIPDNYDAPSYGAVEENYRIRLQTFRMGEVLIASCSCETQNDLVLNLLSRTNKTQGDIVDGFDWAPYCHHNANANNWTCAHPQIGSTTFSNAAYAKMEAEVHNDAKGWDSPENLAKAFSEPSDPSKILGNFTKEELPASLGYALPVGVGHAGDYDGYTVSFREFQSRDHYRKALTCCGPHTADYMVTRLERMAGFMNGGAPLAPDLNQAQADADEVRQNTEAIALGQLSEKVFDTWSASLPDDKGMPAPVTEPVDISRFNAATFTWRGGSNGVDNPTARVERLVNGAWTPFADQSGEVQTMVHYPKGAQGVVDTYTSNYEWLWTANFEAFDAFPRTVIDGGQIPAGTYRFVIDGLSRHGGANAPYHLESTAFGVGNWKGVTASNAAVAPDGSVSFTVSDTYPRSYVSGFRYVHDDGGILMCRTCSFRPWASHGDVLKATVTVVRADNSVEHVDATLVDGVWTAATALQPGDHATIEAGGIVDSFGETNGTAVTIQ
jgi:hypothetical protein